MFVQLTASIVLWKVCCEKMYTVQGQALHGGIICVLGQNFFIFWFSGNFRSNLV